MLHKFTLTVANLHEFNLDVYHSLVEELAKIDKDNIETELVELPVYYSYYHGLMLRSKRTLDRLQIEFDNWCATGKSKLRETLSVKVTVALADENLAKTEAHKEYRLRIADLEEVYGLMKSVCVTLEHKKDMLIQLSANRRMEVKLHG